MNTHSETVPNHEYWIWIWIFTTFFW